jgi:hypothetical protein
MSGESLGGTGELIKTWQTWYTEAMVTVKYVDLKDAAEGW